jgi:hypothetical protein
MGAFTKCGRIAVAASSVAVLSMNTALLESPKPVEQTNRAAAAAAPPAAPPAAQEKKLAEKQSVCRKTPSSKAPKMAPQFDGLNFYETFIGAAQR